MLFNSIPFIFLFLPVAVAVYFLLHRFEQSTYAKIWLIVASLYFYACFKWIYLPIILASIIVNFFIGTSLHHEGHSDAVVSPSFRKLLLIIGCCFNVGLLGYFKYFDFFLSNVNELTNTNFALLGLMLPLGISFFTFQQLAYVIDSYYGKQLKYNFVDYCLFVSFFPQLIAGPIVLPSEMLPQFSDPANHELRSTNLSRGLFIFVIGLTKKVLIADTISVFANVGFDQMESLTCPEAWLTSLSYTFQLYFDFSGYCDMAIGIGLMLNIKLPINFNSPYKSCNIQEFWQRWHITLGRFMLNYLYIPLGGNRRGELKTLRNLLIVFLVSGLWHGAGWTFILWGGLHGTAILMHRAWKQLGLKIPRLIGWSITFFLINLFWIFFRASTLDSGWKVMTAMFSPGLDMEFTQAYQRAATAQSVLSVHTLGAIVLLLIPAVVFLPNSQERMRRFRPSTMRLVEQTTCFVLALFLLKRAVAFLYFNF